eukprot:145965_1
MATWNAWINKVKALGFKKATIIARANYQTLASSSSQDIATLWSRYENNGNKYEINENQELLDDWSDTKRSTFCFYGKTFRIVLRGDEIDKNIIKQQNNLLTFGYVKTNNTKLCTFICDVNYDEKRIKMIQRRKICKYIVAVKNREIIIAYQFKTIWFIAYGLKQRNRRKGIDFYGAQEAWNQITYYFDYFEQCEV